jgi:hypothetical protein
MIDVAISYPGASTYINTLHSDQIPLACTKQRETVKHKKYDELARVNNYKFVAFAMESTGAIGKEADCFINEISMLTNNQGDFYIVEKNKVYFDANDCAGHATDHVTSCFRWITHTPAMVLRSLPFALPTNLQVQRLPPSSGVGYRRRQQSGHVRLPTSTFHSIKSVLNFPNIIALIQLNTRSLQK